MPPLPKLAESANAVLPWPPIPTMQDSNSNSPRQISAVPGSNSRKLLALCLAVVQSATGQSIAGDLRDEARTTMVNLFHLLGPEADLTKTYRRRLATTMY